MSQSRRIRVTGECLYVGFDADLKNDRVHEPADFVRVEVELPNHQVADVRIDPLSGLVTPSIYEGVLSAGEG